MRTNPYNQDNLRHGAFHYLMGRGAAGVAGFLTVLLLVRFMDINNYAAYTALSGLGALCGVLAGLGMERVVSRYVPEARLHRSVDELGRFIWVTSVARLIAALIIMTLLFTFWPVVATFLAVAEFKVFSIALVFFVVGETMFQHFSSVLQSLVMQKTLTRLLIIQWMGRLFLIAIVVMMKSSIDWQDTLWISSIPELLGVIAFVVVIQWHLKCLTAERHVPTGGSWPQWKKVTEVGFHNFGFTLLAIPPQGYFMKLLTAAYLPVEIVAAYGFFLSVAEKVRQYIPLHFFYGMLEPVLIANYLKDRDFAALSYRCQLLYKSNLLLMVPAIAWVSVAGDSIVGLMTGGKFHGLSWILVLVMVQLTVGSHVVLLQLILNTLEKSKILIKASMIALPVMMISIISFIIFNSMYLLITPIVFSLVMNTYIVYYLTHSAYTYKPSWSLLSGVFFAGLVTFILVSIAMIDVSWTSRPLVYAVATLSGVIGIYALSLWIIKAIDGSEVMLIKSLLKKNI